MKILFLTLGLTLAATAAEARTLTLPVDHIGCATLAPYTELIIARDNKAEMDRLYRQFKAANLCGHFPKGTQVEVQQVNGRFVCLRPVGWNFCGWTLLFDAGGQVVNP